MRTIGFALLASLLVPFIVIASANGRRSGKSFLQQGAQLLDRDHFADSVAMLTRAIEQNPKDIRAYYYRALANEMVDRQAAIGDWQSFVDLTGTDPEAKQEITQAEERLQKLKTMPQLPDSLRPSRYVRKVGDYYQENASANLLWIHFPVSVYAVSPPRKWQGALRDALAAWSAVIPLRQVPTGQEANITISWVDLRGRASREQSFIQVRTEGDRVFQHLDIASIVLDNSHHWSGPEMRLTVLHELGHALGISGPSNGSKDVMIPILYETITEPPANPANLSLGHSAPLTPVPGDVNTRLTTRDVNTLIRLYNCSGPVVHLE